MVESTSLEFELVDQSEEGAALLKGRVVYCNGTIEIILDGYGTKTMGPGHGSLVYLENYEGKPVLYAWSDINEEDPTDKIGLSGAKEENREPDEFIGAPAE